MQSHLTTKPKLATAAKLTSKRFMMLTWSHLKSSFAIPVTARPTRHQYISLKKEIEGSVDTVPSVTR